MIKIGIIGSNFGKIGLLPTFNSVKNCKVVAIGNRKNWRQVLENKELDAIALAVPPNIQYQIAKTAIKNGLHIFAEKPLSANISQAQELSKLAEKHKVTTCVDFMFTEIPEWKKVKEILDNNTLGKLQHISVNWNWLSGDIKYGKSSWKTNIKKGGGVLSFYFSHGLYYLEHFAGEINNIQTLFTHSKESKNGAEVGIDMLLKFKNGITGNAQVFCNTRGIIKHQLIFQCEKGLIILKSKNSIVDNFKIKIYSLKGKKKITIKKNKTLNKKEDERVKIVRILAKRFINACMSKTQMSPSFKNGLRVQELIEMARNGKINK